MGFRRVGPRGQRTRLLANTGCKTVGDGEEAISGSEELSMMCRVASCLVVVFSGVGTTELPTGSWNVGKT